MERLNSRGGVPVFSLPNFKPTAFNESEKPPTALSPALPPVCLLAPTCIKPLRNVPVVIITDAPS